MKYEYKIINNLDLEREGLFGVGEEAHLRVLNNEGWELVAASSSDMSGNAGNYWYLKRKIKEALKMFMVILLIMMLLLIIQIVIL